MAQVIRPLTTLGVTLARASMIAAGPGVFADPQVLTTHAVTSIELLASQDEIWDALSSSTLVQVLQVTGLPLLIGGDFDSFEGVQQYVTAASEWLQTNGELVVSWGSMLEPWISPIGISGVDDWLGNEYAMFSSMLDADWDPAAWLASVYPDHPDYFYAPIADFDLGWVYSILGAPEEAFAPLNELLGLQSSLVSGYLNEFLFAVVAPVGIVAQVLAGDFDLTDSTLMDSLVTGSWEEFTQPAVDSLTGQIQDLLGSLQGMDGTDFLLSLLSFLG